MILKLHTYFDKEEIEINFENVRSMNPVRSWANTRIVMKDGEVIAIEEPADEIMKRLVGKGGE